ncbi:MAG: Maf family nucleotide pyrophosphatase [Bacteroidales bacterium]
MSIDFLKNKKIILASGSPRRQQLLKEMGVEFEVQVSNINEDFPSEMVPFDIAPFLAKKKADYFNASNLSNTILITSDTTVCLKEKVLNKPADRNEAIEMLQQLSGNIHYVVSGVCLKSDKKEKVFSDITKVFFRELTFNEILHYVDNYKPFDKAGAYGIQEWIGAIGIKSIEGSFYNVMGLPTHKLWEELKAFS